MDLNHLKNLADFIKHRLNDASLDEEERAHLENFAWDERPPQSGIALYARRLGNKAIANLDQWKDRHQNFVTDELYLDSKEPETPWTFRADNAINRLRQIDPRINLIRVEDASWPCDLAGLSPEALDQFIKAYQKNQTDAKARDALEGFLKKWNSERDQRPLFATTELEVEDIIDSNAPDWAERLRDRLGLGHYSNRPVQIILMRYTVQEVLDSLDGEGYPVVPSVLDSDMSQYFFPSPIPKTPQADSAYYGHTVNLAKIEAENDYAIGVELLHPRIDYKPEHLIKIGFISKPFATRQKLSSALVAIAHRAR